MTDFPERKRAMISACTSLIMLPVVLVFVFMSLLLFFSEEAYYCTGSYAGMPVSQLPVEKAELYATNGFLGIKQFWLSYLCLPIIICFTSLTVPCLFGNCCSAGRRDDDY